ncbi:MAG TPA: nucleoside deaminase [Bryobacteraceae bacterium]|nr:nucleoside deaminase [Bryobacteraceae bacterium]
MSSDELMRRVIRLAEENVRAKLGGPFAAIVSKNGEIVAEGTNLVTSTNDPTAHAELVAIRRACVAISSFQLVGLELYTSCEPCPMCLGAIYWARPSAIYYGATHNDAAAAGFDDSFIYEQTRLPVTQRAIPMRQALSDEAQSPFAVWRNTAGTIPY